jgi:hypothetical protein
VCRSKKLAPVAETTLPTTPYVKLVHFRDVSHQQVEKPQLVGKSNQDIFPSNQTSDLDRASEGGEEKGGEGKGERRRGERRRWEGGEGRGGEKRRGEEKRGEGRRKEERRKEERRKEERRKEHLGNENGYDNQKGGKQLNKLLPGNFS